MEKNQSSGEEITRYLLVEDDEEYTEERRSNLNLINGEDKVEDHGSSGVTSLLIFSSLVAVCGSFNYGLAVGYSSPVESEIVDDLGISTAEYSLFGSCLTIGGALGAIACGKMSDYIGRKLTFGVAAVCSIAGWVAIIAAQGVLALDIGRVLLGFALGLSTYVIPIYVAEITTKDLRGRFVTLHYVMISCGIATAYVLGVFISWRVLATIGIIPNLSQLMGLFFIPESPRWLVKVHKDNEFENALQRLRGSNANISTEAADIKDYNEGIEHISKVSFVELFQRRYVYALTVGIGMFTLSQLVGSTPIVYYASSIFQSAGFSAEFGTIIMAGVQVLSVFVSLLLMDRFGRRPLLMVSACGVCWGNLLSAISFTLQDYGWLEGYSPYLALFGILLFISFYSIGIGGITFLLISEIYPMNVKGLAGSVAILVGWITSWCISYAFNFSMEWSSAGTFFILTGICAFTLLFVLKLVPETKSRTLEEIQASINHMFLKDHEIICDI